MTHEELLGKIGKPFDEGYQYCDIDFLKALRTVVELHKPLGRWCDECLENFHYPCQTIQAIEKELS